MTNWRLTEIMLYTLAPFAVSFNLRLAHNEATYGCKETNC